jgi:hypothetical protein
MKNAARCSIQLAGCLLVVGGLTAQAADTNLVSVLSKFEMKIYGYVKLDASYDTQRTSAGDLMYYVLPEVNDEKDDEFNMTAKETRLGLDIKGPEVGPVKTTGKIETDFYGPGGSANSPNIRMRLGYLDLANANGFSFRAGQDWETFITVTPKILNFTYLADAGALGLRRPQARLTQEIPVGDKSKLTAKIAAARTIGEDIDGGGQDDGADSGTPSVQGNLIFETPVFAGKPAKISVSGHYGRETLDTSVSNKITDVDTKDFDSWSLIGSILLPFGNHVAVQGSAWQGANLDNYFGGIGQGINKTLDTEIGAKGGWAQLVLDPVEWLNCNLGYGLDDPDDGDLNKGNRSKNELLFANVFFKLNSAVTLGFEYSHMTTSYQEASDATDNRFQGSAIYRF